MVKIGVFDSGRGGFSLLKHLFESYPDWEVFYIADHAYAPYGNKSRKQVQERSLYLSSMLVDKEVDLIIVGCNTATALSINLLRETLSTPFVGIEPYLNVINIHPELVHAGRGVVLSTQGTNESERFLELKARLDPESILDYVGLPRLASIIEDAFDYSSNCDLEKKVQKELHTYIQNKYDFAILGCTHYPLIRSLIEKILEVKTYSPGEFVVKRASQLLGLKADVLEPLSNNRTFNYYSTLHNKWETVNHSNIAFNQ